MKNDIFCSLCGSEELESISLSKWKHDNSAIVYHCLCCDKNWIICECEKCNNERLLKIEKISKKMII